MLDLFHYYIQYCSVPLSLYSWPLCSSYIASVHKTPLLFSPVTLSSLFQFSISSFFPYSLFSFSLAHLFLFHPFSKFQFLLHVLSNNLSVCFQANVETSKRQTDNLSPFFNLENYVTMTLKPFKPVFIKHNSNHKMWPSQKEKKFVEQGNLTLNL